MVRKLSDLFGDEAARPRALARWLWQRAPWRGRQGGTGTMLVMAVLGSLLLGGAISTSMRVANLRSSGQALQGKYTQYCAEAGLAAGRDFFRANTPSWNSYLQTGYTLAGQAALPGNAKMQYLVRVKDNYDEVPNQNNPNVDSDSTIVMESTCADPQLGTITLRQYLTLNPLNTGPGVVGAQKYDKSSSTNPSEPTFTGNAPLNASGGLAGGNLDFSSAGIKAVGVDMRGDQIQLSPVYSTLPFLWISNSGEGTISKLNTDTGQELGRYLTAPFYANPSPTSVDLDGNVWVGNRSNNTLTKVGLKEAGNCVDRNGNGLIDTSTAPSDLRTWTGTFGGGVAGAKDECLLQHVAVSWTGMPTPSDILTVAVGKDGYVFVGGVTSDTLYKVRGSDGVVVAAMRTFRGHYGGVVDGNGNVWTSYAGYVQKMNPALTTVQQFYIGHSGYGIAVDRTNRIWTQDYGTSFSRINNDGTGLIVWGKPLCCGQGLAVDQNGEVWLAGSLSASHVLRYSANGAFQRRYDVGAGPTGVSIASDNKVWTSNYFGNSASRIDPISHAVSTYPVGYAPYNYSDMTGFSTRNFTERQGTWSIRQYCGESCNYWRSISWGTKQVPTGTTVSLRARAALNVIGLAVAPWRDAPNGFIFPADTTGLKGRVIEVEVKMTTQTDGVTPIVDWVTIEPYTL